MSSEPLPVKHPGGRRKGPSSTREAIVKAAVELFAERGYERATLREITARAGVDVAMVSHFFGGKQGLFDEAVVRQAERGWQAVRSIGPTEQPAVELLTTYFSLWENEDTSQTVRALIRAALESEEHRVRLEKVLTELLGAALESLVPERTGDDAAIPDPAEIRLRGQLIATHLLGVGIARYIMRFAPIADISRAELVERLTPVIESYLPDDHVATGKGPVR